MKLIVLAILILISATAWSRSIIITQPIDGASVSSSASYVIVRGTVDSVTGGAGVVVCNTQTANFTTGVNWIRAVTLSEAGPNLITCSYTKDGLTATDSITVNWAGNIRPYSDFISSSTGLVTTFDSSLSHDPDGTISTYEWNFGDGTTGTGPNPTHTFPADGLYFVQLKVTDNNGAYRTKTRGASVTSSSGPTVSISNLDIKTFNEIGSDVVFSLSSGVFVSDDRTISIFHNDEALTANDYTISGGSITIPNLLVEGKNTLELVASDTNNNHIYYSNYIWAGNTDLEVTLTDNNQLVTGGKILAHLSDDRSVVAQGTTVSGILTFNNLPESSISLTATYDSRLATDAIYANENLAIELKLIQLGIPSVVDNNDFSLGTSGWDISQASAVTIENHIEVPSKFTHVNKSKIILKERLGKGSETSRNPLKRWKKNYEAKPKKMVSNKTDQDLNISTSGVEGRSSVHRIFQTLPGTTAVKVRYKFSTDEYPDFYGTKYNDEFSIVAFTTGTTNQSVIKGSMNELGPSVFKLVPIPGEDEDEFRGVTNWRELEIKVNPLGDIVYLEASVVNVGDEAVDSNLILDYVNESQFGISSAALHDLDATTAPLTHISLSGSNIYKQDSSNEARTLLKASLEIYGEPNDAITDLELVIIQNGLEVATGKWDFDGNTTLKNYVESPFGIVGKKFITAEQLFSIKNSAASLIDMSQDGFVHLQIRATSKDGHTATYTVGSFNALTRYTQTSAAYRYGGRDDVIEGGDDWCKPSTLSTVISLWNNFGISIGYLTGDISNMNGGFFERHAGHRNGVDIDAYYTGYGNFDAASAQKLLSIMQHLGNKLKRIWVTHPNLQVGDPFFDVLNDPLATINGVKASVIVKTTSNHESHFHIELFN